MNKQTCDKIKLIIWGIIPRIKENSDFIKGITYSFGSGLKKYEGSFDPEGMIIRFNGKSSSLNIDDLPEYIANEALNYDTFEFVLSERGKSTIINADNKSVRSRQVDSIDKSEDEEEHYTKASINLNRNYYIKIGEADQLLKEIGILTKEGKIKNDMIRKYNQIDHFVELVDAMIDEMSDLDTITVMDCGCGKSYLTFVLNYYIKEKKKKNCYFIGIDRSEKVIKASKEIAGRLGYKNMQFIEGDINTYEPDKKIDMVISLHACDTATDMALGLAIRVNARAIMCVPCCHKELLSQYSFDELNPIMRHGVFKARFADMLTDGIRTLILESRGYKVSVVEYISPLETPKNLLIRAVKTAEKNYEAANEYQMLKEMFGINPYLDRYLY